MKIGLNLKLAITVVLIFVLVIATCLLWRPVKYNWLRSRLLSDDSNTRGEAIIALSKEGSNVIPYIRLWLRSDNPRLIVSACRVLERMEQQDWQQALPELETILSKGNWDTVISAAALACNKNYIWHKGEEDKLEWHSCWKNHTARKNLCFYVLLNATADLKPIEKLQAKDRSYDDWQTIRDKNALFFRALHDLCNSEEKDARIDSWFQSEGMGARLDHGWATEIMSEGRKYIVCILSSQAFFRPGGFVQKIILIGKEGQILDSIGCGINDRYGGLSTNIEPSSAQDGAQLVIRFNGHGNNTWHNWHHIVYQDKTSKFQDANEKNQPSIWNKKGLCRIKITKYKFEILFPELEDVGQKKE